MWRKKTGVVAPTPKNPIINWGDKIADEAGGDQELLPNSELFINSDATSNA
jgi:hypothetical protein